LEEESDAPVAQYNVWFIAKLTSIAAIGGFLFGYDTGVISGAQLYFVDTWPDITAAQRSLTVSIATLGAAAGSLVSGVLSDKYGRKPLILFADFLFTLGAILMGVAPTIPTLMTGRFFVGLGVGIAA
jgi:SP family myo-inositol transporter-like MFS transporter 13